MPKYAIYVECVRAIYNVQRHDLHVLHVFFSRGNAEVKYQDLKKLDDLKPWYVYVATVLINQFCISLFARLRRSDYLRMFA